MYKVVVYNSIHNVNGTIEYDYSVIKVVACFNKAIEYAMKLKAVTGKLYKVERV